MSKKETDAAGGLTSSAGLSTYYDAEKDALSMDPRTVIGITVLVAIFFTVLNVYFNLSLA
jgi:preprotein translocase subunit Sec61beta